MKAVKNIRFLIMVIILSCYTQNRMNVNITVKEGLYFGKQGGFPFPSQLVFIESRGGVLFAECYFPLKGGVFKILGDTLRSADQGLSFMGDSSIVLIEQGNAIFQTNNSFSGYKIKKVILEFAPDKQDILIDYRKRAKPWNAE